MYEKLSKTMYELAQKKDESIFMQKMMELIGLIDHQHIIKEQMFEEEIDKLTNKHSMLSSDYSLFSGALRKTQFDKLVVLKEMLLSKDYDQTLNLLNEMIQEVKE